MRPLRPNAKEGTDAKVSSCEMFNQLVSTMRLGEDGGTFSGMRAYMTLICAKNTGKEEDLVDRRCFALGTLYIYIYNGYAFIKKSM